MPRTARPTPGGYACHVRGVDRMAIFDDDGGYHFSLVKRTVAAMGLGVYTFRPRGRPRKAATA